VDEEHLASRDGKSGSEGRPRGGIAESLGVSNNYLEINPQRISGEENSVGTVFEGIRGNLVCLA